MWCQNGHRDAKGTTVTPKWPLWRQNSFYDDKITTVRRATVMPKWGQNDHYEPKLPLWRQSDHCDAKMATVSQNNRCDTNALIVMPKRPLWCQNDQSPKCLVWCQTCSCDAKMTTVMQKIRLMAEQSLWTHNSHCDAKIIRPVTPKRPLTCLQFNRTSLSQNTH